MNEYEQPVRAVWDRITSVNDGHGLDAGDLMAAMDDLGATCPEDLANG